MDEVVGPGEPPGGGEGDLHGAQEDGGDGCRGAHLLHFPHLRAVAVVGVPGPGQPLGDARHPVFRVVGQGGGHASHGAGEQTPVGVVGGAEAGGGAQDGKGLPGRRQRDRRVRRPRPPVHHRQWEVDTARQRRPQDGGSIVKMLPAALAGRHAALPAVL